VSRLVVDVDGGYDSFDTGRRILAPLDAEVVLRDCRRDAAKVVEVVRDADAVLVRESPITVLSRIAMRSLE
jgi:hypothetical protein